MPRAYCHTLTLLKRDLAVDLLALANTIDLASAVDIADLDYVKRSIVNFGLPGGLGAADPGDHEDEHDNRPDDHHGQHAEEDSP